MLFLDLDGTALDVRQRHYATYTELIGLPDMRGKPIPEKEYWELKIRKTPWDTVLKHSRLFPPKYKLFKERFVERLETPEMLTLDELRVGTETFLGKVYTKTPIILLTQRRDKEALESQLASLKIRKYFAEVLAGAPKPQRRPRPDDRYKAKAQLVRKRYKFLPTEALYIGDTETDVQAARDLGFEVFLMEGGHRTKALQIKADPDRICADLAASLKYVLSGGRWQR